MSVQALKGIEGQVHFVQTFSQRPLSLGQALE
jgi:hypothetical protein